MFELNTLRLVAIVSFVGFVFITMMLWRLVPQERSLKYWGFSALLIAAGMLLLGLRTRIPDFLSIVAANTFITLGVGYMFVATRMLLHTGAGRLWH